MSTNIEREALALLSRIVADDPIYNDPDEGPFCVHCMKQASFTGTTRHAEDCTYIAARALIARSAATEK